MSNNKISEITISDKGLYFAPLGGSEEFGANLNLYVCDGEYLAIDCGIGFADDRYPGIDLLLPDVTILEENKDKLKGLIITHGHEDHVGAVAYLWDRFRCPVYASPFTACVLRKKLEQEGLGDVQVNIIKPKDSVKIGSYKVQFIPVSHSIPDACSMFIQTKYGNILHSGDWNLDQNPIIGHKSEEGLFKEIGEQGVLAYIGDSTNAQVDGYSGSENEVAKGLAAEFSDCKGKIVTTIFSSNINRIISIARAAEKTGRSVAVIGRSLHKMIGNAHERGYMKGVIEFISEDEICNIPDENIVIIVTGSQGEHRAALARIARRDNKNLTLGKNDTVIFSSRLIPGNERSISTVRNDLSAAGVTMITPRDTKNIIHVSGHPCKDEISSMLEWIKPSCVIPVHGERQQLDAQKSVAENTDVNQVIVPNNGSVIRLAPDKAKVVGRVRTGLLAVDQRRIIPITHQSITARRKLQYSGAVHASLVLDDNLNLIGRIKIDTVGLSCTRSDDCIIEELQEHILSVLDELADDIILGEDEIAEKIRISLRRYVLNILGLRPKTTVHATVIEL